MTSLTRRLKRNRLLPKARKSDKPQRTVIHADHYITFHPTKGARRVSNKRVTAHTLMSNILQGFRSPLSHMRAAFHG